MSSGQQMCCTDQDRAADAFDGAMNEPITMFLYTTMPKCNLYLSEQLKDRPALHIES